MSYVQRFGAFGRVKRLLVSYMPLARFAFCCYKASYSRAAFLNVYACAKDTPASRAAILQLSPLKSAKHKLNS